MVRMVIAQSNKKLRIPTLPSLALCLTALSLCSACGSVYTKAPAPAQPAPPATPAPNFETQPLSEDSDNHPAPGKTPGLTARPSAKAPPIVPEGNQDLWSRINRGITFAPQSSHPRVEKFITWYQNNPSYFQPIFKRAPLYLGYITAQLERSKMPLELALLPFVESAYNPFAYSRSGAAGLWQFIPSTGDHMGLTRNWWYDGRRDIVRSTDAAIRYLSYLNKRFEGDWLLTLAAYNGGEGTVSRAMRRNVRAGKATDFWSLDLSRETSAYVPQLLALARICENPERYGLAFPSLTNSQVFTAVDIPGRINLDKAAELAGIDYDLISRLNPGLRRGVTPPEGPHRLLLPSSAVESFASRIAATPKHLWQPARQYIVKSGDTLGKIALHNGVPLAALKAENGLSSDRISIGRSLNIPGTGVPTAMPLKRETNARLVYYRVRRGDSLWKIARIFEVNTRELAQWNQLNIEDTLRPGQTIRVYPGAGTGMPVASANNKPEIELRYRVKHGDSLYSIAQRHRISIADIMLWNRIKSSDLLHPGQYLRLPLRL